MAQVGAGSSEDAGASSNADGTESHPAPAVEVDVQGLQWALALTRERLSLAVDSAGVGLWEIDLQIGARWFSDTAAEIMGHPANEPISRPQSLESLHPDDRKLVSGIVDGMIRGDQRVDEEFEYRLNRYDCEGPLWVVSTGRVMRNADGTPLRVVGSVRDITAKRRQREELARMAFEDDETKLPNRRGLLRWLSDRSLSGAEALLRWGHPERGLLSPINFIDELARSRWAYPVGKGVLERACADAAVLARGRHPIHMGVNLFASQFKGEKLDTLISRMLTKYKLPAECIEIEITENIVLADDEDILKTLKKIRNIGCGIAFDDYGIGFASLSMLKRYPITRLKIDRSFVSNICTSFADRAIVEAVIGLGRAFQIKVIAEGIETEAQHAALVECGCTDGQGYLYGRPMPFGGLL